MNIYFSIKISQFHPINFFFLSIPEYNFGISVDGTLVLHDKQSPYIHALFTREQTIFSTKSFDLIDSCIIPERV